MLHSTTSWIFQLTKNARIHSQFWIILIDEKHKVAATGFVQKVLILKSYLIKRMMSNSDEECKDSFSVLDYSNI